MASYVDQTPVFRPYVQQLPVEAMSSVGLQKQTQYNEGYQRIQSQIDKIAGLSIMRDVDKQYFQSKMNQLGANLRMVSMGDLSNYQLVNSIGGMVSRIGSDKNIQNAVMSTSKFRAEQEKMENAQKAGKSSVNREYDFNKAVNEYLTDPKVGSSFNGRYKEHIDVNKKVLDVIAKLHPNIKIQDIAYGINPDGSINTGDILSAMHRQGITEVNENQIRTAINAVLDENDYDELASAGRYHYREYDQSSLLKVIDNNHRITRDLYKKNLEMIEKDLLTATNPSQVIQLNEAKKQYMNLLGDEKSKGKLEESYNTMMKTISTNPDAVRAELYTRNWLDQIANGFSYREVKDEVLTNPIRTDYWKLKEYEWDQIKESHLQQYRNRSLNLEEKKFQYEQMKDALKSPKEGSNDWVPMGDATTSKLRSLENYREYNIDKPKADATNLLEKIAGKFRDNKVALDRNGALILIEKYKNGKYVPPNPDVRGWMDDYIKSTALLSNSEEFLNDKEDAAAKKVLGGLTFTEKLRKRLGNINDLLVNVPGQGQMSFSSREIYNFLTKEKLSGVSTGGKSTIEVSPKELTEKEKMLYIALKKRYDPYYFKASTDNPEIDDYISQVSQAMSESRIDYNKVQNQLAEDLADITGDYGTEMKSVQFPNDADKKLFIDNIRNLVTKDKQSKAYSYDVDDALASLDGDAKDVSLSVILTGDNYRVGVAKGGKFVEVPVPRSYIETEQYLGGNYLKDGVSYIEKLISENGSSNRFGVTTDYNHAYYQSRDIGHLDSKGHKTVTLPVVADLDAGNSPNRVFLVMKLKKDDGSVIFIHGQNPQNILQCEQQLKSLTDANIISMFKEEGYDIEKELTR